jgi:hypothetical protein
MMYRVARYETYIEMHGYVDRKTLSTRDYRRRWLARLVCMLGHFPPPLRIGFTLVYRHAELREVAVPGGVHSNDFPCRCDACRRPRLVVSNDEGAIDDHLLH